MAVFSNTTTEKDRVYFTETGKDTDGKYSLLVVEVFSGTGPPLHYHKLLTHKFTILEGIMYLTVGNEVHALKKGDVFIVPPKVPHMERSEAGKFVKCTVEISPAHEGYEDFMNMTYSMDMGSLSTIEKKQIYLNADTYMP